MPDERDVLVVNTKDGKVHSTVFNNDIAGLTKAQLKERVAAVLERARVADKSIVTLKDGTDSSYLEWVADYKKPILEAQQLGFEYVMADEISEGSMHNDGTGHVRMGDAVLMKVNKQVKEIVDEIRVEDFQKKHGKKGRQAEEKMFVDKTRAEAGDIIPTSTLSSSADEVDGDQIRERLAVAEANTHPASPVVDVSSMFPDR